MKEKIHPTLYNTVVKCTCGNEFTLRTTVKDMFVEVCAKCHPFYTGQKRNIDRGGMVERFNKKYNINK